MTEVHLGEADILRQLDERRDRFENQGLTLVQCWNEAFPRGALPFRLVRLGGESNTLLRWRSGAGGRQAAGRRLELIQAMDVFAALPEPVRNRVLEIEQQRIAINHEYALAAYAAQQLRRLLSQRNALAQLRRLHHVASRPPNPSRRR
jgi:hypothetical protein